MDNDEFYIDDDDSDDFEEPEEISELDNFELCNFEIWWEEQKHDIAYGDDKKDAAQAAWLAAYRF